MVKGSKDFYISVSLSSSNMHVITDVIFFPRSVSAELKGL